MFSNPRRWASAVCTDTSVLRSLFEAHFRPSFVSFHLPTRSPRLGQHHGESHNCHSAAHLPLRPCDRAALSPHLEEGHSHLVQDAQSPIQDLPDQERDVEMTKTVPCQIGSYWRIGWGTYQENDSSVKGGVGMLIQIQFLSATHWTSHFAFAFNVDKEAL